MQGAVLDVAPPNPKRVLVAAVLEHIDDGSVSVALPEAVTILDM
jgi:hypothetical protein